MRKLGWFELLQDDWPQIESPSRIACEALFHLTIDDQGAWNGNQSVIIGIVTFLKQQTTKFPTSVDLKDLKAMLESNPLTVAASNNGSRWSMADSREATGSSLSGWLLPRVLELTYTAWDLEPFARDCGYAGPPFRWDEERRGNGEAAFNAFLGASNDLIRNIHGVASVAELDGDEIGYLVAKVAEIKRPR